MPLPANIAALSQNPALNGPDGSTDAPALLDDGLRLAYSFIAQLRDGVGYTAGAVIAGLGFAPVQQGGGANQGSNKLYIGYSTSGGRIRIQVDSTDYGSTWPIDISGSASSLGGRVAGGYAHNLSVGSGNVLGLAWDGTRVVTYVDGVQQFVYTEWTSVSNRPTNLSQFTNGPGYITGNDAVLRIGAVTGIGNSGGSALTANITGFGAVAWGVTPSDRRLKLDIEDSTERALDKVCRIRFVGFRFKDGIDDGRRHEGAIAQELQEIDPNWVNTAGTYLAPNTDALLMAALHAIKQLRAEAEELRGRIIELEDR